MSPCLPAPNVAALALVLLGTVGDAAHDMMARLSPAERSRTLGRVLHGVDDSTCDVVEATFVSYRSGVSATWRATCSEGRRFVLDLMDGSDWSATVVNCAAISEQQARCAR